MCSRDIKRRLLLLIAVYAFVIPNPALYLRAEETKPLEDRPLEKGWATLSGILVAAKIDSLSDTDWRELALEDAEGGLTIIIGELAQGLLEKTDKYVTLTGVYKPSMNLNGKQVPVLEVRFIDQLED